MGSEALELTIAQIQQKKIREENLKRRAIQTAERMETKEVIDKYGAFMNCFQVNYQTFMEGAEAKGQYQHKVHLVLVDPPYSPEFTSQGHRTGLAKIFSYLCAPGATAVVFLSYRQVGAWHTIFSRLTTGWQVEGLFALHRDPKYAFRSNMIGHKRMSEYVMIAHKKDKLADAANVRNGSKVPATKELEEILGDAPSGSWLYDFMVKNHTVPAKWYAYVF